MKQVVDSINIHLQRDCNKKPACKGCYLLRRSTNRRVNPYFYELETREVLGWIFDIMEDMKDPPELNFMLNYINDRTDNLLKFILDNKKRRYQFNLTIHKDINQRIVDANLRSLNTTCWYSIVNLQLWNRVYISLVDSIVPGNSSINGVFGNATNVAILLSGLALYSITEISESIPVYSNIWKRDSGGRIQSESIEQYMNTIQRYSPEPAVDNCIALPANGEACPAHRGLDLEGKWVRSCPYTMEPVVQIDSRKMLERLIYGKIELEVPKCTIVDLFS